MYTEAHTLLSFLLITSPITLCFNPFINNVTYYGVIYQKSYAEAGNIVHVLLFELHGMIFHKLVLIIGVIIINLIILTETQVQ